MWKSRITEQTYTTASAYGPDGVYIQICSTTFPKRILHGMLSIRIGATNSEPVWVDRSVDFRESKMYTHPGEGIVENRDGIRDLCITCESK
jgi:hypothetical protein